MTSWPPARLVIAALVVLTATATASVGAALGSGAEPAEVTVAYVIAAAFALVSPAAIAGQVVLGQVLTGSLLLGPNPPAPWLLVLLLASVVITAELLALVARLDTPVKRDPGDDLRRSAVASIVGAGVFGAVLLVDGLPGPTGLTAVSLAAGICILLASLLVTMAR